MERTVVELWDDLDGGKTRASTQHHFSYGGEDYVIDLNEKNSRAFEKFMDRHVAAATKVPKRGKQTTSTKKPAREAAPPPTATKKTSTSRRPGIRTWAAENGITLGPGRIPKKVEEAYDEAHA